MVFQGLWQDMGINQGGIRLMTKKEKELISKAVEYDGSPINGLYIFSTHKLYKGFWGKNGYNSMIILGYAYQNDHAEDKIYHFGLDYERDVIQCFKDMQYSIDFPHEYDCVRFCFKKPIIVSKEQLSAFMID